MRLLVIVLALAGVDFGQGYESFRGVNNTYNLHTERVTWETASEVCQLEGGHLIVINCNKEATIAKLLFGRIPKLDGSRPWFHDLLLVGINDKAQDGVWRTVLGGLLTDAGYNVWHKGEPNNANQAGNVEQCGCIDRFGRYVDLSCDHIPILLPFICEKEATGLDGADSSEYDIDPRKNKL